MLDVCSFLCVICSVLLRVGLPKRACFPQVIEVVLFEIIGGIQVIFL